MIVTCFQVGVDFQISGSSSIINVLRDGGRFGQLLDRVGLRRQLLRDMAAQDEAEVRVFFDHLRLLFFIIFAGKPRDAGTGLLLLGRVLEDALAHGERLDGGLRLWRGCVGQLHLCGHQAAWIRDFHLSLRL